MAKHADRMAGEGKNRRSAQQQNSSAPNGSQIPDPYNWKHPAAPPSASDHMSNSTDPNCAIALTSSESGRYGMAGMNGGHPRGGSMSEDMLYSVEGQKNTAGATSAFTPIQSTIPGLPAGTSPSSAAAGGHRSASAYFPYGPDSFGFGSSPGKSGNGGSTGAMDMKMDGKSMGAGNGVGIPGSGGTTAFPNQLIALHQIRNYASMPGGNIPTSLASTEQQQQQQSNNNSSNNNNSGGQSNNSNKDK